MYPSEIKEDRASMSQQSVDLLDSEYIGPSPRTDQPLVQGLPCPKSLVRLSSTLYERSNTSSVGDSSTYRKANLAPASPANLSEQSAHAASTQDTRISIITEQDDTEPPAAQQPCYLCLPPARRGPRRVRPRRPLRRLRHGPVAPLRRRARGAAAVPAVPPAFRRRDAHRRRVVQHGALPP